MFVFLFKVLMGDGHGSNGLKSFFFLLKKMKESRTHKNCKVIAPAPASPIFFGPPNKADILVHYHDTPGILYNEHSSAKWD